MSGRLDVTVRDRSGSPVVGIEVLAALVIQKFINWWDGQFVRVRLYGTDYQIFVNSGWNYESFKTPLLPPMVSEPMPQFWPPTHSIKVEVWPAPGGLARYRSGEPPALVVDLKDVGGLWYANANLIVGSFPRWAGIPILVSDPDPKA